MMSCLPYSLPMALQSPNTRFRQAVLGFYAWLAALAFATAAPFVALHLIERNTVASRVAAVVVGTIGWLPLVAVVAWIIRAGDEFNRGIHLVALACAFASALVILTALDWMARARFIAAPSLSVLWLIFALVWAVWIFTVKYWFEHRA